MLVYKAVPTIQTWTIFYRFYKGQEELWLANQNEVQCIFFWVKKLKFLLLSLTKNQKSYFGFKN